MSALALRVNKWKLVLTNYKLVSSTKHLIVANCTPDSLASELPRYQIKSA